MKKQEKLEMFCARRKAETSGECYHEDCIGIGWCAHVLDMAAKGRRKANEPKEGGSNG